MTPGESNNEWCYYCQNFYVFKIDCLLITMIYYRLDWEMDSFESDVQEALVGYKKLVSFFIMLDYKYFCGTYEVDKNIIILHLSCRTSDLQFSLILQTHALVL